MEWGWRVARIWTGRESLVGAVLRTKGLEVFLPMQTIRKRWSDRMRQSQIALFPGYLFFRNYDTPIRDVLGTDGVLAVLVDGKGEPAGADPVEMASLRSVTGIRPLTPGPCATEGSKVRIEAGPLCGAEGVVMRTKNRSTLVVSVSLLGRSVAVEVDDELFGYLAQAGRSSLSLRPIFHISCCAF